MLKWIVWFPLKVLARALGLVGFAALALTAMIATPLASLPELTSISKAARAVDRSSMPPLSRFSARDGTELSYRHYPARGPSSGKIAILVHGSSGSSTAVHPLADALAARGVETYAPDIRGHGGSGTRGDIGFIGQLENDMEDLVTLVRKTSSTEPLTLLGHSAGGGFALRIASSPIQDLFARTVLLAPYLGYDAPTNRPNSGGWASADIPRFLALAGCDGSVSIAASRCRHLLLLCQRTPNGSSIRIIPIV
jgi:pimeloyl-ACP methyl ester carboxylesterase